MRSTERRTSAALLLATMLSPQPQLARADAAQIYSTRCAACHESGQSAVPTRAALAARSVQFIIEKLSLGSMQSQTLGLSDEQIAQLANFLSNTAIQPAPLPAATP